LLKQLKLYQNGINKMREKIKILDGPLEDEDFYIDRRLMKLYDEVIITDKDFNRYQYMIMNNGLKFIKNA